jgi:hypothetical protein
MGLLNIFKRNAMYLYTQKELEAYENFIKEQFGEYDEVFHEVVSPDIHLDIIVIPPTESNNYYTLITMGMGAYKMAVPRQFMQYNLERAELAVCLPPTWNIKSDKEEDYWPIRQLKNIARLPIQCNTWLGYGHTVSSDAENTPYASNTNLCSMMLLTAVNKNYETLDLSLQNKGKINFYQLFPLYKEELDYKQRTDADTLLELFEYEDITPVVNINRRNYRPVISFT